MSSPGWFVLLFILIVPAPYSYAQNTEDLLKKDLFSRLQRDLASYKRAVSKHDTAEIAESCYLIAKRQIGLGNYAKAQKWLLQSLEIQSFQKPTELTSKVYLRMNEIQFILGNYTESLKYSRLALKSVEESGSDDGLMGVYSALGSAHMLAWEIAEQHKNSPSENLLDSAIYYHDQSLKIATKRKSVIDIGLANQHVSRCWFFKNNPDKNRLHKNAAIDIYQKANLSNNSLEIKNLIANEYLSKRDPVAAKPWLDQARVHEHKDGTYTNMKISLEQSFAIYYEQIGDWRNALSAHKKINDLRELLFYQYRNEAVEGIRKTYDYELKELQLSSSKKEIGLLQNTNRVKNGFLAGTIFLLVVAAIASVLYGSLYFKYKKVSRHNAMLVEEQSHRTKNSLQAISSLLSLQIFKSTELSTNKALEESLLRIDAINLVHQMLHKTEIPLFIDLPVYICELIEKILFIHKMKVGFHRDVDNILLHAEKAIPFGLIINELVTNACKYGLDNTNPELFINCQFVAGQLCFEMKDNGKGIHPQRGESGFGLDLIENLTLQLKGSSVFVPGQGCHYKMSFPVSDRFIVFNAKSLYQSAS